MSQKSIPKTQEPHLMRLTAMRQQIDAMIEEQRKQNDGKVESPADDENENDDEEEVESPENQGANEKEDSSSGEEEDEGDRRKTQKRATSKKEKDTHVKAKQANTTRKQDQALDELVQKVFDRTSSKEIRDLALCAVYAGSTTLLPAALKSRRTQISNGTYDGMPANEKKKDFNEEHVNNFVRELEAKNLGNMVHGMRAEKLVAFARKLFAKSHVNDKLKALDCVIDEIESEKQ